jgi:tRNA threonylcarbamoyladenosine biosynthesis protein TsaE
MNTDKQKVFDGLDEEALLSLAGKLARRLVGGTTVYMQGNLGAGKTTFTRGMLQSLGHEGAVKSPTYTIVEPYADLKPSFYHFDLYRLSDPEELEYMGIRDYFDESSVCIIEWPDKGLGYIEKPDLTVSIEKSGQNLRKVTFSAYTVTTETLVTNI